MQLHNMEGLLCSGAVVLCCWAAELREGLVAGTLAVRDVATELSSSQNLWFISVLRCMRPPRAREGARGHQLKVLSFAMPNAWLLCEAMGE